MSLLLWIAGDRLVVPNKGKKNCDVIGCESLKVFIILGLYKTPFYKSQRIPPQLSCSPQTYFLDSVITTEVCSFTKHSRLGTAVKVDNTFPGTHWPYLGITIKDRVTTNHQIHRFHRTKWDWEQSVVAFETLPDRLYGWARIHSGGPHPTVKTIRKEIKNNYPRTCSASCIH